MNQIKIPESSLRENDIPQGMFDIIEFNNAIKYTNVRVFSLFVHLEGANSYVDLFTGRECTYMQYKLERSHAKVMFIDKRYCRVLRRCSSDVRYSQNARYDPDFCEYYFESLLDDSEKDYLNNFIVFSRYGYMRKIVGSDQGVIEEIKKFFRIYEKCNISIHAKIKRRKEFKKERPFDIRRLPLLHKCNEIKTQDALKKANLDTYGSEPVFDIDIIKAIKRYNRKHGTNFKPPPQSGAAKLLEKQSQKDKAEKAETEKEKLLYLMKDESRIGVYKIGVSVNPKARESTLQSERPSIKLVGKWKGRALWEGAWHRHFASNRLRGEWFELSKLQVQVFCKMNTKPISEMVKFLSQC